MAETINATINFKAGDLSGLPAVDSFANALNDANKEIDDARKSGGLRGFSVGGQELDAAARRLKLIELEAGNVRDQLALAKLALEALPEGTRDYDEALAKVLRLESAFDSLREAAQSVPSAVSEGARSAIQQSRGFESAGQASSALSGFAGAAGIASPELAGLLQGGADIAGALEQLKAIPSVMADVGTAAQGLKLGFGAAAEGISTVIGVIPGVSAGFAAAAAVLLPLVVVLGTAAAAFAVFQNTLKGIEEQTKATLSGLESYYNLISQGASTEDAQRALAEQRQQLAAAQAERDQIVAAQDAAFQAAQQQSGDFGARLLYGVGTIFSGAEEEINTRVSELDQEIAGLQASTAALENGLTSGGFENSVQAQVEALNQQAQIAQEVAGIVASGSQEQLDARREQIQQEIALINQMLPQYQALAGENADAAAQAAVYAERLGYLNELDSQLVASTGELTQAREDESDAVRDQLESIRSRIDEEVRFAQLSRDATVEQVNQRQQAIADEISAIQQVLPELEALAGTSDEAAEQLDQTRQRLADLRNESNRLNSEVAPEARRRQIEEGQQALAEAESASAERIKQIRESANQALASAEERLSDARKKAFQDAEKAALELAKKTNKAVDDENKRYMESESKAVQKFQQEELKAQKEYNKQRQQLLNDLNDSLLQAEEDNDVIAFIRAKRAGEDQLKNLQENTDDATQARTDQFLQERAEADKAHNDKLQQIRDEAIEQGKAIQDRKNEALKAADEEAQKTREEIRKTTDERIAAERKALQDAQARIRDKFNLETTAGKTAAETIKQAFLQAAQAVKSAVDSSSKGGGKGGWDTSGKDTGTDGKGVGGKGGYAGGSSSGKGSGSGSGNLSSGSGWGGGSSGGGSGSGNLSAGSGWGNNKKSTGFARGGVAPAGREINARFEGDRRVDEAIVPLQADHLKRLGEMAFGGMMGQSSTGVTVNINGDFTIGDGNGVTEEQLNRGLEELGYTIAEAIQETRLGVR